MVFGSHAKTRAMYSTPPCPSLAASTAAYRRLSFSDNHPKKRCIFPSISAEYTSMSYSLLRDLLRSQDTTAQAIREVILDHILRPAADCLQPTLVPRCGFRQRLRPGVRLLWKEQGRHAADVRR